MANLFDAISNFFKKKDTNLYNEAFFQYVGGLGAKYDEKASTYLNEGFGRNPDVFSMIMQMADKSRSVPYYVKKIANNSAKSEIDRLNYATKGQYSISQLAKKRQLETKAFEEKELPFPLPHPNPTQTWGDIISLFKVYMKTTGNFYLYMNYPLEGNNANVPKQVYVLPSHMVQIVLKKDAKVLQDENPIEKYMLIEGNQYIEFPAENIIHVKYANPFFDFSGSHLYGLSPIKALLRNIESSNEALNQNVKTIKNGGAFGFIGAKDSSTPLTAEQAIALKEKLKEMDNDSGRLSRISGMSVPLTFTRISLTTDELKPFEFLKHDQKAIANVLGWSDKLLNNDDGAKYDNVKEERKRVITDNILPDLLLLAESLNKNFIPRFKGYENAFLEFDITELPEMQDDIKQLVEWMVKAPLTLNEQRAILKYEALTDDGMDVIWLDSGKKRIDEVGISDAEIRKALYD